MKINEIFRLGLLFFLYMALQFFWVKEFVFLDVAFCFIYMAFIICLPLEIPLPALMLIAFLSGLLVDLFYNTLGIHAATCVFIIYMRPSLMGLLTPLGGYDVGTQVSINAMGIRWYIIYVLIIVFFHHLVLFTIEAGGFKYFYWTILKVVTSTLFSSFIIISLQYLFLPTAKRSR